MTRISFYWSVNIILTAILVYITWGILWRAPVNLDAGYYLLIADYIHRGLVPFKDFALLYTPIAPILFALESNFTDGVIVYELCIATVLLIQVLNSALLYRYLRHLSISGPLRYFSACCCLAQSYLYDGIYIILEPFVLLFSLLGLIILLDNNASKKAVILAGLCAGLSFLSKQYGVAVLVPMTYLILELSHKPAKAILYLLCSFSFLPVLFLIDALTHGATISDIIATLSAPHIKFSMENWWIIVEYFFSFAPFILLLPFLYSHPDKDAKRVLVTKLTLICIMSYLLPLVVRQSPHYFILIIPFCVVIGTYIIQYLEFASEDSQVQIKRAPALFTIAILLLGTLKASNYLTHVLRTDLDGRKLQRDLAASINKQVPRGSNVIIAGDTALFYLLGVYPEHNIFEIYLPNFSQQEALNIIFNSRYFIYDSEWRLLPFLIGTSAEDQSHFEARLRQSHDLIQNINQRYSVWRLKVATNTAGSFNSEHPNVKYFDL